MFSLHVFILFFLFSPTLTAADDSSPLVTSPLGQIKGYQKKSPKGTIFSAFEGIPYAKPPIGSRRFAEPEPIDPWKGTWEAKLLTECPQTSMLQVQKIQGEEDCLYLNVYVPRQKINTEENLDVIVHIHGGGFMYGSGHSYARPDYFMDSGLILVTFNYRLGIFGFLSTEDEVVSGNNGLKDQAMALRWVQENIGSFGGNPGAVTLTGLSSGAASVHLHYFAEVSEGLFSKGFSQSGVALNSFAIQEEPLAKARKAAKEVECPVASTVEMVECLRQRPFRHIMTKMGLFQEYRFFPHSPFGPVLEKGSKSPFLTTNLYYLLAKGKVRDLPWLTSSVSHEGLFPAAYIFTDLSNINENWTEIAPHLLDYGQSLATPMWKSTGRRLKQYYFEDQDISSDNFFTLIKMFSDRFLVDVDAAIKLQAKHNKSPVYHYHFSFPSDNNKNRTVGHTEDAQYFFYGMFGRQPTPNELKMKELLFDMLISFARSGHPKIEGVTWEPTTSQEVIYLNISSFEPKEIQVQKTEALAPRDFWQSLGFLENQNLVLIKDEL